MKLRELLEAKSKFQKLKDNEVPLTKEERAEVMRRKAVWHKYFGSVKNRKSKVESAVWKSVDPKTGKTTFVTHTHRVYNISPTLKGIISRFHNFVKGTA